MLLCFIYGTIILAELHLKNTNLEREQHLNPTFLEKN